METINNQKCIDCGKIICKLSTRCKSCANKYRKGKFYWNEDSKERRKTKKNPNWKGDKVKYDALHSWIRRHKSKPKLCEKCKKRKPFDLSNISGKYKRDVNDFEWLCRSCHMEKDGRLAKLFRNLKISDAKKKQNKKEYY